MASIDNIDSEIAYKDIYILENIAVKKNIEFKIRYESAYEVYVESGRKITVLHEDGNLIKYIPDKIAVKDREKRLNEYEKIINTIENNNYVYKLLLLIIFTITIIISAFYIYRYKKMSGHVDDI